MALKFYGHLNLDGQQLQDVSAEKVASVVTGGSSGDDFEGRLIFVNNNDLSKGELVYKNLVANGTPTSPATGWVGLSGDGAVSSISLADSETGLTIAFDAATDLQTISLDYTTPNNFILAAGSPSTATIDGSALSNLTFLKHENASIVPHKIVGTHLKTAVLAGVSSMSVVSTQPVDSHIEISDVSVTAGVLTFTSDLRAGVAPGDAAAQADLFLRATSATASGWDAWTTYTDTTYALDVDAVNAGGPSEYAKIHFVSTTDAVTGTDSTIKLVPSMSPPDSGVTYIQREISIIATETVDGVGAITIGLQNDLQIEGTLTLTAGSWDQSSVADGGAVSAADVSFSHAGSTSTVTGALNLTSVSGVSSFPGVGTDWVNINKTADQYTLDAQWANKAYVTHAAEIAGAMTFRGTYDANVDPDTSAATSKGDMWVVGVGGSGAEDGSPFWEGVTGAPVLATGDFIIALADSPYLYNNTTQHWTVVQSNIGNATTTIAGICSFPDAGEATPGGWKAVGSWDDDGKPEPLTQTSYNLGTQTTHVPVAVTNKWGRVESFSLTEIAADPTTNFTTTTTFTDDVQTRFNLRSSRAKAPTAVDGTGWVITHDLGSLDVIVQVYDQGTKNTVFMDVNRTTVDTVTLIASGTHAQYFFTVVVTKVT